MILVRVFPLLGLRLHLIPVSHRGVSFLTGCLNRSSRLRHLRLQKIVARLRERREGEPIDVIQLLRERADALAQRAAGLKKLADAWQPLSETLDASQKQRLRFLTLYVLREMGDRVESRRMMFEDMADED